MWPVEGCRLLHGLVEVWWRHAHCFPFYITCDKTFGTTLVRSLVFLARQVELFVMRRRFGPLFVAGVPPCSVYMCHVQLIKRY